MKLTTASSPVLTPTAFQQLYQQHAGQLCGYLIKSLRGDMAEAEGIVQDAFLKAWEKRQDLRNLDSFKSWLYSIAINVLKQRKRKLRPMTMEKVETKCERPSPEQHAAANQELDRVMVALDNLPDDQREAILLVRLENMMFREAAVILDVPESTVKTRVRRGLLTLAKEVNL
ncbi:MAG: RNA polymerase sigma factor [Pseudodesulfovibrio sp.]|nr:RNA polymerase sigma factor [Pseudodesulfovibrio sp.]